MHNASQLGPGLQKQRGEAPVLKRAREAAPQVVASGLATIAILCVLTVAWVTFLDHQSEQLQSGINAQQAQSEAGGFAIDHFRQCKHEPTLRSLVNTNADCIDQLAGAAQSLKGDQIVGEMMRYLATWVTRSTGMHGRQMQNRGIADYIAKYGFSLVRLAGTVAFQGRPR